MGSESAEISCKKNAVRRFFTSQPLFWNRDELGLPLFLLLARFPRCLEVFTRGLFGLCSLDMRAVCHRMNPWDLRAEATLATLSPNLPAMTNSLSSGVKELSGPASVDAP
jgi:hypothetical protein